MVYVTIRVCCEIRVFRFVGEREDDQESVPRCKSMEAHSNVFDRGKHPSSE